MMPQLFRITTSPESPKLVIQSGLAGVKDLTEFHGDSKISLSPKKPFIGNVESKSDWGQFYHIAPGALALSEEAWENCMDMYYECSFGTELLSVETPRGDFRAINPLDFAPLPKSLDVPFNTRIFYAPLFRMRDYRDTDLFCFEGSLLSAGGFKSIYERFEFKGLDFECIWMR